MVSRAPEALDPRFTTSALAQRLSYLVFAPLLTIGEDLSPRPLLAQSLIRIDDVTWEVTLRKTARFHDGTAVTADDVIYTYSTLADPSVRSPHGSKFKRVLRYERIDARTMRFVLDAPFAAFPIELCAIGIVSKAHCENRTTACRKELVGAGPFAVERFSAADERLTLRKSDTWALGEVRLPRLSVRVVRDGTTRLLELIDGKADLVVGDIPPPMLDVIAKNKTLVVDTVPGLAYAYLAMNLRPPGPSGDDEVARTRSALSNITVRQAISHAIDVDRIINTKLRGAARRATGMLPPGHWAKDATLKPPAFDQKKARTLLDQAGFPDRGPDAGGRFKVVLNTTTDRLRRSIAVIFAYQLRQVGIDVTVRVGEWATLYQDIKRGNFEMFSAQWTPVVDPDLFHWVFHSASIPGPGKAGGNRGAYRDAEVDDWIEEGRRLLDEKDRAPLYRKVERRLLRDLPYVPLWFEDKVAVHNKRVLGFALSRTGSLLGLAQAHLAPPSAATEETP